MNRGARYKTQRSSRVRLKADCAHLVHLIQHTGATVDDLHDAITEMRIRLHPPTGYRAPVILTGYTEEKKR